MSSEWCWECKKVKHNVNVTGSFLCDLCREELFIYLREKAGGNGMAKNTVDRKKKMEEVKRLLKDTDMAASEIAKKTGIKEATVYYHQTKIRGVNKPATPSKDKMQKAKPHDKQLEITHEQLKSSFNGLQERFNALMDKYAKASNELLELRTGPTLEEVNEWKEKYEREKAAHDLLIQYVTLIREKTS